MPLELTLKRRRPRLTPMFMRSSRSLIILFTAELVLALTFAGIAQQPAPQRGAPAAAEAAAATAPASAPISAPVPCQAKEIAKPIQAAAANTSGGITEEELKQMLVGKTFYLRGGYLDDNLAFNAHRGRVFVFFLLALHIG